MRSKTIIAVTLALGAVGVCHEVHAWPATASVDLTFVSTTCDLPSEPPPLGDLEVNFSALDTDSPTIDEWPDPATFPCTGLGVFGCSCAWEGVPFCYQQCQPLGGCVTVCPHVLVCEWEDGTTIGDVLTLDFYTGAASMRRALFAPCDVVYDASIFFPRPDR